jgi:hypothetical protein
MQSNFRQTLGNIIFKMRKESRMTQDDYGKKYRVAGPAIFKFEQAYLLPPIELWMRMALDGGLSERLAVLMWLKAKLPCTYQDYIELESAVVAEAEFAYQGKKPKPRGVDYSKLRDRESIRKAAESDMNLPKGLREFLMDNELWALMKPTSAEVNMLRDIFGPLGRGSMESFREALRLLREFTR